MVILGYSNSSTKAKEVTVTTNGQLRDEKESLKLKNDSPDLLIKHLQTKQDMGDKTVYLTSMTARQPLQTACSMC